MDTICNSRLVARNDWWVLELKYQISLIIGILIIPKWGSIDYTSSFEPPRDKTNKMACAPSEDSDQPGHPPSLIRVFAVRMKKPWVLSYSWSAQPGLIRLDGCPCWFESSPGTQPFCWFCHEAAIYNWACVWQKPTDLSSSEDLD